MIILNYFGRFSLVNYEKIALLSMYHYVSDIQQRRLCIGIYLLNNSNSILTKIMVHLILITLSTC